MRYSHILFDLDGTLIDTNELILQSFEHTFETFFPGQYTRADILPHMGQPLVTQFGRFAPDRVQEMIDVYREHNIANHDRLVTIFPDVREVLQELKDMGCTMAVVTSKMRRTALMGVQLFGIESFFDAFVTIEDTDKHKPHPEPLLLAMKKIGAQPDQTLMIGDSPYDIEGGKRAGVATCGVAWSLRGEAGLRPYWPDYVIREMKDLLPIIRGTGDERA